MKSSSLRSKFLAFFEKNSHKVEKSSPAIPANDPTILFANAGMNQFKDLFLGNETRSYTTATTSQKCVRAGGKHNDLDQVGFTDRHLTFFEMLGNFSFGDYFKKEAIAFAWKFLTEEVGIDKDKLSVTIHHSDDESYEIWKNEIGVPTDRITRLGDEDNFWQMGDTGPCGPCTEIFYDRGPEWDNKIVYGEPATRHLEVWNLVFMQYEQAEDGSRKPLTQTGVDTGMGLERLAMVLQNGETVFDSDVFAPIISKLEQEAGKKYKACDYQTQASFNVVADHIRTCCIIIADGGKPSNDGRGYVLRKIIRRGLLFLKKLTKNQAFFSELANTVANSLEETYPEIKSNLESIISVLTLETERFSENLQRGQKYFDLFLEETRKQNRSVLSGEHAFKLYDTYGFPLEVSSVLARENGLSVDREGFEQEMEKQRKQSDKQKCKKTTFELPECLDNHFTGYQTTFEKSKVIWVEEKDGKVWIAAEKTPFFTEKGGQVSDSGVIKVGEESFKVLEVISLPNGANKFAHLIGVDKAVSGKVSTGSEIKLEVDENVRINTARNHTGTHLIHQALQDIFGSTCRQAASLVHPDYLRFGFTLDRAMTESEITRAEKIVNDWIQNNAPITITNTTLEKACEIGAMSIFGEKYNPESVRVVDIGGYSIELCGGTHLNNTGQIGCFKIMSEESLGTGERSITAVTGPRAVETFQEQSKIIKLICEKFASKPEKVFEHIERTASEIKSLQKEAEALRIANLEKDIPLFEKKVAAGSNFEFVKIEQEISDQQSLKLLKQKLAGEKNRLVFLIQKKDKQTDSAGFSIFLGGQLAAKLDATTILEALKELGWKAGGKKDTIAGRGKISNIDVAENQLKKLAGI